MEGDSSRSVSDEGAVQMIGTLPPWKGISDYCEELFEGLTAQWDQFTFTGWRSLYPKRLYPGGDPKTERHPLEDPALERTLAWYDPLSWLTVGFDPDVELIHAQWWSYPLAVPYVTVFVVGKLRGKTVLLTVHNVEPHEQSALTTFLNDVVYRFADEYVVHSERNRSQLTDRTDIDPDDVNVISHPVIGPEKRGLSKGEALNRLGLPPETNAVLFFGNVRDYKGLDDLIRMVDRLNHERDVDLLVAGKSWVEWDPYESLIDRCGLDARVHRYPGYIPDDQVEQFFAAAEVVALPYQYFDAQSGVARLADHFGTVSVGYDVGGLAEQVDMVASTRDEFERSLLTALDGTVEKRAVHDDSVEKHAELYRRLLDQQSRGE